MIWFSTFLSFWYFLFTLYYICIRCSLYVLEKVWLSLAAVKVSSWKCNTELNLVLWSSTDSSGSSSAWWSVFYLVSPFYNPITMDSAAREPFHRSSQIWNKFQRFYFSLFGILYWQFSFTWYRSVLYCYSYDNKK